MVDLGADAPVDNNEIEPGANLYNVDLRRADLSDATLSEANLSEANLSGADLSGADLSGADLYNADLPRVDLSGATLSEANLSKSNLSDSSLSSANFLGAEVSNADLSGADLSDASLSNADLSDANLSGADFSDAYVSDANLSGADLSDTSLSHGSTVLRRVTDLIDRGRARGAGGFLSELNNQPETSQPQTATDEIFWNGHLELWPTVIALTIPGWFVVLFGVNVIPPVLFLFGLLAVYLALPIALILDAQELRNTGECPRYWAGYVLISLVIIIIPAVVYLWRRRANRSQNSSKQAEPSEK